MRRLFFYRYNLIIFIFYMTPATKILFKPIENQTILWLATSNEYLVVANETAAILQQRSAGIAVEAIASELSRELKIPNTKAAEFIVNLEKQFTRKKDRKNNQILNDYKDVKKPVSYGFIEYYSINKVVFKVSFLSEKEREWIHPKFAHLALVTAVKADYEFDVFINHNYLLFYVNQQFIGAWNHKEIHYFQGKFSMELIQKIHQKEEKEWLGVFHASAVSNGKKSILFLGDSGNGKSTSLALLQANGFTCLADDFVPVSAQNNEVYSFPAAISIKRNSLPTLLPLYPSLESATEYDFTRLNKVVRYLPPNNNDFSSHLPCNDLIFIKYEKNTELTCREISKIDAFQQLVPDSWLSPIKENAAIFLDWFKQLNCYQIIYSENDKMIATVEKIFANDL